MNFITHIKRNTRLALPVALGQVGQVCMNLVDNIMVGSLGGVALGTVALANAVFLIVMVFGMGMASSVSPLVAQADACDNKKEGITSLQHGLVIGFFLSLLMYLIIWLFIPMLSYLNQPKEVIAEAGPFLNVIGISLIPWMLAEFLRKFCEGLSLTTPGMLVTWIAVIYNVIFNYLLIYGHCGFPKLGVVGAAYATLIARIVLLFGMIILLKQYRKIREYYKELRPRIFQREYFRKILSLGTPAGLQMLFEIGAFAVASFIAGLSGTNELAAHQISMNLASATYMLSVGFAVAATIRIGNQKALKNYIELRRAGWSAFLMSGTFMIICAITFICSREYLPYIFVKKEDIEIARIASNLLIIAALFQLSDSIQSVALGALRGMQDVKIPMWLTFFAYWVVAIPLAWYCSVQRHMGAFGVWIGLGVGLTVSSLLLITRYNKKTNRLIKNSA
ncbi:MATE family efflux transporter [Bacteroidetes bacterium endosymbiont of Geopemphigus sp.]|uniref:MATE family efflux transporter n=1 Tax=Bacteroidetes bacterium endosymbiont of Geopemphigus sp. TaxID=2047937 RepID=UPI001F4D566C|nr:MATE family efflux transporter [Bacteroidetes bacterium endosymbiont of Geopemphigus sp.]